MAVEFDPGAGGSGDSGATGFTSGAGEVVGGLFGALEAAVTAEPSAGFAEPPDVYATDVYYSPYGVVPLTGGALVPPFTQTIVAQPPPTVVASGACPPGSHQECAPCPEGAVCAAVCSPICVSDTLAGITDPIASLISALTGGGAGSRGGPLPIGTAGTRLVAAEQKKSALPLLIVLAVLGGVGYWWYRKRKKAAAG